MLVALPETDRAVTHIRPMNRFCTLSHKRVNLFHLPSDSFMDTLAAAPAAIAQPTPQELALSGAWTARGVGAVVQQLESLRIPAGTKAIAEGARIEALDTAGAWVLQKLLLRLRDEGTVVTVRGLRPEFARLLEVVAQHVSDQAAKPAPAASPPPTALESIGRSAEAAFSEAFALLSFVAGNWRAPTAEAAKRPGGGR